MSEERSFRLTVAMLYQRSAWARVGVLGMALLVSWLGFAVLFPLAGGGAIAGALMVCWALAVATWFAWWVVP